MGKFKEEEWKEYLNNSIPEYTRTVNNNKIKNTQQKNIENLNNKLDKIQLLSLQEKNYK